MALAPGQLSLADIRYRVRARCDRLILGAPRLAYPDPYANDFITSEELDTYINAAWNELYGLMTTVYGNYYNTASATFTTTGGTTEQYPLPLDCLKLISAEYNQTGVVGNNLNNITLKRFNIQEHNRYSAPFFMSGPFTGSVPLYAEFGPNIWFKPCPNAGMLMQLLYAPIPLTLADSGSISLNSVVVGNDLVISVTGQGALPLPAGEAPIFEAIAFGVAPVNNPNTGVFQFVVGGTGATNTGDTGTAASLAATINLALNYIGIQATANGTQVFLTLNLPVTVLWYAITNNISSVTMSLLPNVGSGSTGTVNQFTNILSGYLQWTEYVVIDAAIRCMQKEESFDQVQLMMAQKMALKERIENECDNRDAGLPSSVTDYYGMNGGAFGIYGGGMRGY